MSNMLSGSPILIGDNSIPGIKLHQEVEEVLGYILKKCTEFGLDYYPPIIEFMTYDEISEIASYGGFPQRYMHWQFGMEYEELSRGYEYGMHRISEMIINSNPSVIYCLDSNPLVDQVDVICHALGHSHFFKNNIYFAKTNRDMLNKMANHGTRINRYMDRWGEERVSEFIDHVLRIDTLIDPTNAWKEKVIKDPVIRDSRNYYYPDVRDNGHDYMLNWFNTDEFKKEEKEKVREKELIDELELLKEPEKDVFAFLRDNAHLKPWQQDIMSMLYDEALYFAPQRQTKTANEGCACLCKNALIPTNKGFLKIENLVNNKAEVEIFDGIQRQKVVNWFTYKKRKTVKITTERGIELEGSTTHKIIGFDGTGASFSAGKWKELGKLQKGDFVVLSNSPGIWSNSDICFTSDFFLKAIEEESISDSILKSNKLMVATYLKVLFDFKGTVEDDSICLRLGNNELLKQVQIVLMNFGILSWRKENQLNITKRSRLTFFKEIGCTSEVRKEKLLQQLLDPTQATMSEFCVDSIVSIEYGEDDVYDFSVENSHRYVAHGITNHNSWVDHHLMAVEGLSALGQKSEDCGIVEYAIHKMLVLGGKNSMNPYKIGFELLMDIEERWNKGRFGEEYEECRDFEKKKNWDIKLGKGKEKVFEVCKYCNDFTLIQEFFTPEFCEKHEFFNFKRYPNGEHKILNREFKSIRQKLLARHANGGLPDIRLADPNGLGKGWMMLIHYPDSLNRKLYDPYVREVMLSLFHIWKNCITLESGDMIWICDGPSLDFNLTRISKEKFSKEFVNK